MQILEFMVSWNSFVLLKFIYGYSEGALSIRNLPLWSYSQCLYSSWVLRNSCSPWKTIVLSGVRRNKWNFQVILLLTTLSDTLEWEFAELNFWLAFNYTCSIKAVEIWNLNLSLLFQWICFSSWFLGEKKDPMY